MKIHLAVLLFVIASLSFFDTNVDASTNEFNELSELEIKGKQIDDGNIPIISSNNKISNDRIAYYISNNGNDNNTGTSPQSAWKSIDKINSYNFPNNSYILFKTNDVWLGQETLKPHGDGLTISSYGFGKMPKIAGQGKYNDVIRLTNQKRIEISNLNISNKVAGFNGKNGNKLKELRGIHIVGKDGGELSDYNLHNLYVHDVSGNDVFIGGTISNNKPGVIFKGGWDNSKNTGGIVFDILKPDTSIPTIFNNVKITNNFINNNSYGGVIFKQWNGSAGTNEKWASRDDARAENNYHSNYWAPHKNIIIMNNYFNQQLSNYACDSIYLTSTKNSLIKNNIIKGSGTSGIEVYYTDRVTIERNETSNSKPKAGGVDSNGIDSDKETTNTLIQYNFIHDNGDGILLCGINFSTTVVRYNVLFNNGVIRPEKNSYINIHGEKGIHYIYNNVFYHNLNNSTNFIYSSAGQKLIDNIRDCHYFNNNIFYNDKKSNLNIAMGKGTSYDKNNYYNVQFPVQDRNSLQENPQFSGILKKATWYELNNLQIIGESKLHHEGNKINHIGVNVKELKEDFFNNLVDKSRPSIGISE